MKKSVLIFTHLLFWLVSYLALPYMFQLVWFVTAHITTPGPDGRMYLENAYPANVIIITIGLCIFYASYFSLRFFLQKPVFFLILFAAYTLYDLIISLPADLISSQAFYIISPILYFNLGGFLFRAINEWLKDRKIKAELEKDKLSSQLELLKSKIDPHFLFNNLNNIDIFIQEDPNQASEYLRKLSDILRFMLYESNAEKVSLSKEIAYISKYIDLQKIRTNNPSFVNLEVSGDMSNKEISPMILIHFIENAFKYASNKKIENAIRIRLELNGNKLFFFCKNHIHELSAPEKNGLGAFLLKQKLDLLYANAYSLNTKEENNWYLVTLEIQV
jgi:sensor histidine kinase YesM